MFYFEIKTSFQAMAPLRKGMDCRRRDYATQRVAKGSISSVSTNKDARFSM